MENLKNNIVLILINNLDYQDYLPILKDNIFSENLLIIFDKNSITDYKQSPINYLLQDFNNPEKVISEINNWVKVNDKNIVGIIGLDEEYKYALSKTITDHFNLKYFDQKIIDIATSKYLQRTIFKKNNINVPNFKELINSDIEGINFPNVIKPVTGISSFFVFKNNNENELKKNLKTIKSHDPKRTLILEEFIGGDEYSCDYIVDNKSQAKILRVVKKLTNPRQFPFFEGFYLFNPDHEKGSDFKLKDLQDLCSNTAKAIGLKRGVCMMDFKFYNNKLFIIETTIRPGLSQFMELMKKIYGYTSVEAYLKELFKLEYSAQIPKENGLIFYITTEKTGILKKFDTSILEDNFEKFGIIDIKKYFNIGDKIKTEKNKAYSEIMIGSISIKNINM
ncbi:MAG: ATP-grasp domain-containing protein, partial [bacterium]